MLTLCCPFSQPTKIQTEWRVEAINCIFSVKLKGGYFFSSTFAHPVALNSRIRQTLLTFFIWNIKNIEVYMEFFNRPSPQ